MKNLILGIMIFAGTHAAAESVARDALSYIVTRYRDAKMTSPSTAREIALACEGEILKIFTLPYFAEMDRNHVQKSLVPSYQDAFTLIQSHEADAENIYPKLRQNLIPAIQQTLSGMRSRADNKLPLPPATITLDNYGQQELVINLQNCNATEFVNTVAGLAPLTGSFNDYVEGPAYRVPIGENDGDFGTGDEAPVEPTKTTVNQKLSQWMYEIFRR